jgi:hypothetical protein
MHRWCFAKNTIKQRSIKFIFRTISICIFAWLGIASIQATEINSGDTAETTDVSFQNEAQAQRAKNIAAQVASQDTAGRTIEEIIEDIYHMRSSGMGWGEIAQYYGLHPSISGLGNFKSNHKNAAPISKQPHWKTELQEATARNHKGGIAEGHGVSGTKAERNDLGLKVTKGYRKNEGKGLALGHSKDKGSHGSGHSGDHGSGRGGGHGGGRGGGKK